MTKSEQHIWNSSMYRKSSCRVKHILTIALLCLVMVQTVAQPKSAGASFSYTGLGLCYEHEFPENSSFVELALKCEMSQFISGRTDCPGLSVGLTWNTTIKEWASCEGNTLRFFAGPGVIVGYGTDHKRIYGAFCGLKGRVGGECEFARNALISISISPIIGTHIVMSQGVLTMNIYRNGLIYGLVPEIGIRYRF